MSSAIPPSDPYEILVTGLGELEIEAGEAALVRLVELADLVASWSRRFNLSAHRDPQAVCRRLILDAAALGQCLPQFDSLNDLGSGAGFPGVPLAILWPRRSVHLVEARERRYHFLRELVRSLELENVSVERGRIEEVDPIPRAGAVAQAVGPPETVFGWMRRWAVQGGFLAIPSSPGQGLPPTLTGLEPVVEQLYRVPLEGPTRSLWLTRRID